MLDRSLLGAIACAATFRITTAPTRAWDDAHIRT